MVSTIRFMGQRVFSRSVLEANTPLSQEEAYGHKLKIVGLISNQYVHIYCIYIYIYLLRALQRLHWEKGAAPYASMQKKGSSRAISRLQQMHHPDVGTKLDTEPRDLTRRDDGYDHWVGTATPTNAMREYREGAMDNSAPLLLLCNTSLPHCSLLGDLSSDPDECDPFGHGNCLD